MNTELRAPVVLVLFIDRGLGGLQNQFGYHGKKDNSLIVLHFLCSASYKKVYYHRIAQIFDLQITATCFGYRSYPSSGTNNIKTRLQRCY